MESRTESIVSALIVWSIRLLLLLPAVGGLLAGVAGARSGFGHEALLLLAVGVVFSGLFLWSFRLGLTPLR